MPTPYRRSYHSKSIELPFVLRAREARTLVRRLRARAWFKAVALASGKTAAALEREFMLPRPSDGATAAERKLPCSWPKYQKGELSPKAPQRWDGKAELVERVERTYPGTARWFNSPLWRLLDPEPIEMSELRQIFERLPEPLRSNLVLPPGEATEVFWRRRRETGRLFRLISAGDRLDSLTVLLALIREAETIQDVAVHRDLVQRLAQWFAEPKRTKMAQPDFDTDLAQYLGALVARSG